MSTSKKISVRIFLVGVLVFLIVQINIYFAWTSHIGERVGTAREFVSGVGSSPVRSFLVSEVSDFVRAQFDIPAISSFFRNLASGTSHTGGGRFGGGGGSFIGGNGGSLLFGSPISLAMKYLIDTEVILFTLVVFAISLFLFRRSGIGVAMLRAFEVTSLTILPLGIEIFFFDRLQFNIHASDLQVLAGVAWFTNADVLYLSSAILAVTLLVEAWRYTIRKKAVTHAVRWDTGHSEALR